MRSVPTHYLSDGKGNNNGQPAVLLRMEDESDFDLLLKRILNGDYYDERYYHFFSEYVHRELVAHFWFVAEIASLLKPRKVLELGCGRGDVLWLLNEHFNIDAWGIDISAAAASKAWPGIEKKIIVGDMFETFPAMAAKSPERFDLLCAFDIWEHFTPTAVSCYIAAAADIASEDAIMYTALPAYGDDRNFGEQFPLEFEENRDDFNARVPFSYLITDCEREDFPSHGHLTFAHTQWWEAQFAANGWVRADSLEKKLHAFDAVLPHSQRTFYILRRDTAAAQKRAEALAATPLKRGDVAGSITSMVRARFNRANPVVTRGGTINYARESVEKLYPGSKPVFAAASPLIDGAQNLRQRISRLRK